MRRAQRITVRRGNRERTQAAGALARLLVGLVSWLVLGEAGGSVTITYQEEVSRG